MAILAEQLEALARAIKEPAPTATFDSIGCGLTHYLRAVACRQRIAPNIAECGWLIMLDLYRHHGRKRICVSSACIASMHPPTTALRWIEKLAQEGLLERENDADDARRVFVRLSAKGLSMIQNWIGNMSGS